MENTTSTGQALPIVASLVYGDDDAGAGDEYVELPVTLVGIDMLNF